MPPQPLRIPYPQLLQTFQQILLRAGMNPAPASLCAQFIADASRDGVPSHGLNRFPVFLKSIQEGAVQPNAQPTLTNAYGSLERWNGNSGPGPNNAHFAMNRAIELAHAHGIGCVGLSHTNHWMRAGNYAWQAADHGCIAIAFTNATPTMAPHGGIGRKIGNNPLVIAVPRSNGQHIVLDMAMSQFSWGKLNIYKRAGQQAPLPAGYDSQGKLTTDPDTILSTGTLLPIGYWKGSGLGLMLDLLAAIISGGLPSVEVGKNKFDRFASQTFITIDPAKTGIDPTPIAEAVLADFHSAPPTDPKEPILHPGQRTWQTRQENLNLGVPVEPEMWEKVQSL